MTYRVSHGEFTIECSTPTEVLRMEHAIKRDAILKRKQKYEDMLACERRQPSVPREILDNYIEAIKRDERLLFELDAQWPPEDKLERPWPERVTPDKISIHIRPE